MNAGVTMVKPTVGLLHTDADAGSTCSRTATVRLKADPASTINSAAAAGNRLLRGLCLLGVLCSSTVFALPTVRTMYNEAMAREQALRVALAAPDAAPTVLAEVHAVVNRYETLVAHYPTSSYSDNALWQAGRLALDAFVQFGRQADKDAAIRILRKLAAAYPASKLAAQVPEQIARAETGTSNRAGSSPPVPIIADSPVVKSSALLDPAPAPGSLRAASKDGKARGDHEPVDGANRERPTTRSALATIKAIKRSVLPDAVRITIELDGEVPFQDQRIPDPARVFVDLPGTRAAPALVDRTLRFENDADLVRQVRVGRHPNNTTRVVLDAAGVSTYSVYPLYGPYRLVIDCVRTTDVAVAAPPATPRREPPPVPLTAATVGKVTVPSREPAPGSAPLTRRLTPAWMRRLPAVTPRATRLLADASIAAEAEPTLRIADPEPIPPLPPTAAPPQNRQGAEVPSAPPAKNLTGGFSIARQLGLSVSRIVIDAGHGGHDPGAKGKGITEAELVLDVALRLEKLLQKVPGVEVILTRRTDEFVPLPERTAIANREGADLFLSIHANASTSAQARGIETYFLNFANNLSAAAVAARENATSGQVMGALPDIVKAIALNNKLDESRDFAMQVQRAMFERLKTANQSLRDLGVKQAPFVVLIGAAMPSVLAEISFVTNPQEARLLKGNAYRQRIAESLLNAIRKYQT